MIKTIIKISLITLILTLTVFQAQAIEKVSLDSGKILSASDIELTLDNNTINYTIVKKDNTLYIDSNFFANYFGTDEYTKNIIKNSITSVGTMESYNYKGIYLPLLPVSQALGLRYTYSDLYGKETIRLRSDNEFKVYKACTSNGNSSSGNQSSSSINNNPALYGNTPYTSPDNVTYNYSGNTDYNYSINRTGSNYYGNVNYSGTGYGYCYPEGYEPGYYFGSYGFVSQGAAPDMSNNYYYGGNCNNQPSITVTPVNQPLGNVQY